MPLSEPNYLHVGKKGDRKYSPVVDIVSESFVECKTTFRVTKKDPFINQNQVVVPDPNVILDHFLPLSIISHFVNSSNHYCKGRKESFADLSVWNSRKVSTEFSVSVFYQFIAMIFYLGIVRPPSIKDYWDTQQYMPDHKFAKEL
eukprot:3739051-Ditylum_brightwellii.AAC.1